MKGWPVSFCCYVKDSHRCRRNRQHKNCSGEINLAWSGIFVVEQLVHAFAILTQVVTPSPHLICPPWGARQADAPPPSPLLNPHIARFNQAYPFSVSAVTLLSLETLVTTHLFDSSSFMLYGFLYSIGAAECFFKIWSVFLLKSNLFTVKLTSAKEKFNSNSFKKQPDLII